MVFLDNASTTKVIPECIEIYNKYQNDLFFNPSAQYHESIEISKELTEARLSIMKDLHCLSGQIIFTSSGSESDNIALFCTKKQNGSRIIVSNSEHPAVYKAAQELKQKGYDVVFCPVDNTGAVIVDEFKKLVNANTSLISIMHVNNETGCVNDIKKLVTIAKQINPNVIFHSDGVQAVGKIDVNVGNLGVDLYTICGHKIHVQKGIAALYIAKNIVLKPFLFGGGQEQGIRSSTENMGGIKALEYGIHEAVKKLDNNELSSINSELKSFFKKKGCKVIESAIQSKYIMCVCMPKIRGEVMLHSLEKYGILIGTGSACSSKKASSRLAQILQIMGTEYEKGIIRLSFSRFTTLDEIKFFEESFEKEFDILKKYIS